jgi:hypothetical protein
MIEDALRRIIREEVRAALADMRAHPAAELLTISEAAELARAHRVTVTRWLADGVLPRQDVLDQYTTLPWAARCEAVACLRVDVPSVCPPAASTSSFMLPRAGLEGAPAGSHGKRRDMVTTDVRGGPHQRATGRRRAGHTSVPTHLNVAAQAAERDGPNSPRVARAMGLALADIEAECQRKAGA